MNHSNIKYILVCEVLFIVCCSIRNLAWEQTVLWLLVSMHCCEYWVLWYFCGLCIYFKAYSSIFELYSVLFSTFCQEATHLLYCYVSASNGIMLLPLKVCCFPWTSLSYLFLLLGFFEDYTLDPYYHSVLWVCMLVCFNHPIPMCASPLLCCFLVTVCGMTVASTEEWFATRDQGNGCAYPCSVAALFMHAQVVYDAGQLASYVSTHSYITLSVKSPIVHHTVPRLPVFYFC